MTRGEALKDFFRKTILPVASAALLYCIFRSACVKNGELDYTGRRLSGRRDCPVRAELHSGWNHRRFRPGLAVDCGGVVYIYSYSQIVGYRTKRVDG